MMSVILAILVMVLVWQFRRPAAVDAGSTPTGG